MIPLQVDRSLDCVLRGAVQIDGAVGGAVFAYHPHEDELDVVTSYGLKQKTVAFINTVRPGDGTASGDAVTRRHRIVIRDVAQDYLGERRRSATLAGVGAVTAVPLTSPGEVRPSPRRFFWRHTSTGSAGRRTST